jgi:hypothetical protein
MKKITADQLIQGTGHRSDIPPLALPLEEAIAQVLSAIDNLNEHPLPVPVQRKVNALSTELSNPTAYWRRR